MGLSLPTRERKIISFRNFGSIDLESFVSDLQLLPVFSEPAYVPDDPAATLEALVDQFEQSRRVVEAHAKIRIKEVIIRDPSPWVNAAVLDVRRRRRRAERIL